MTCKPIPGGGFECSRGSSVQILHYGTGVGASLCGVDRAIETSKADDVNCKDCLKLLKKRWAIPPFKGDAL
jgi:hypothetical protein